MNIIINTVPKNLQWIDLIFKDFVDRSLELEGYGFGNIDQINSDVLEYPYLWVDPDRTRVIRNASPKSGFSAMEVEIDLIVADKLRSDVENEVETISDVNEIILSAIAELSQHPYYVKNNVSLSRDVDIVNEWRKNDDIVNRVVARLTLRWPFSYTYCAEPIIYTGLTPSSFSCDPANISNSNFSYSNTIPSGGSLVLPDIEITNTNSDLIDTIPSVVDYVIQNVDWTDSDGSTYSTPYGDSIVATPCLSTSLDLIVYDNLSDFNPLTASVWNDNVYLFPTATGFTPSLYTYYVPNDAGEIETFTSSTYLEWYIEYLGEYEIKVVATDGIVEEVAVYNFESLKNPLFIFDIDTRLLQDAVSDQFTYKLNTISSGTYNFDVDWGDGNVDTITTWNQAETTHTYLTPGEYTITIDGVISGWDNLIRNDASKVTLIRNWGNLEITTNQTFRYSYNLDVSAIDAPTISTNNLINIFLDCWTLSEPDFSRWDLSSVTTLRSGFQNCRNFNGKLDGWVHSGITDVLRLLYDTRYNRDFVGWDTSGVTTFFEFLRANEVFDADVSLLNPQPGTQLNAMFLSCNAFTGKGLENWTMNGSYDMGNCFSNCYALLNGIDTWTSFQPTNLAGSFQLAFSLHLDLSSWDTSLNTSCQSMFQQAKSYFTGLGSWNMSSVTSVQRMFYQGDYWNEDISSWILTSCVNYFEMFRQNLLFDQNVGSWTLSLTPAQNLQRIFYLSNMSTENYTDSLVGWANYVFVNGAPLSNNLLQQDGMTFDTSRGGGANFANAGAARTYLTTTAGWSISGDTVI